MRTLLLLLVAGCGNHDDCALDTPCGSGSGNHYQFCNGGSADNCYYIAGDGQRFHCLTCGDCDQAKSGVASWCATHPNPSNNNSSSSNSSAGLTCSAAANCPSGGSKQYAACASPGGTECGYRTNDGTVFGCSSCSDCNGAVQQVLDWCNGGSSSTSSNGNGGSDASCFAQATTACQACCAANHRDGANYYADGYITCGCGFCSGAGCNTAGDVCHGGSTQTNECAACLNDAAQTSCGSQLQSSCAANSACSQFLNCVIGC